MTQTPDSPVSDNSEEAQNPSSKAGIKPKQKGKDFGLEGTNKTIPVPQPDAQPADELQGTKSKFIPKSPYTRG